MPASFRRLARSTDMWPIDTQRLRFVCSATSRAPSTTFSKSRFDSPCPCVTMQNRCAPAASAARACSRICSGLIIACIGVGASAKRDCEAKPQSSAQARRALAEWDALDESVRPAVRLLVSELITNSVKYGGEGPIRLDLSRNGGKVRAEITDQGAGFTPKARDGDLEKVGGWGLHLVE